MASWLNNMEKFKSLLAVTGCAVTMFVGVSIYNKNEKFYKKVAMPIIHLLDPETAHKLGIKLLKWGLVPKGNTTDSKLLETTLLRMKFRNPIGMAAGFDKHAEAVQGLSNCGFGFVEIGSVTPEPQEGNPKPRVFRLPEDKATINRYGFNSEGYSIVWSRLKKLREAKESDIIIGVNLGKNKNTEDAAEDYVNGIKTFSDVADYFVINVSSPNTPNLRTLQRKQKLEDLLAAINKIRESSNIKTPLFLKLAPDLSSQERQDIADVIQNNKTKVDGLILCNTTINRPNLINTNYENETGGLSGAPLNYISTTMISDMYKRTKGTIPIIGVGGVFSGEDALAKIKAGASLVQLYTSYTYYGPPIVSKIKTELNDLLKKEGYNSVADAVGKNNIIK